MGFKSNDQKIIFGLGNPGIKYSKSRHNIGFMILDALAAQINGSFKRSLRLNSRIAKVIIDDQKVFLIKPYTFMNNSGRSVVKVLKRYDIEYKDILVVYDDVDIDLGKVRYRITGSSGGHKGIGSILDEVGVRSIKRLKVGVGSPLENVDTADYVLADFKRCEGKDLKEVISRSVNICIDWLKYDSDYIMRKYNRK